MKAITTTIADIPSNAVKLRGAFINTIFQVPINYFPSARRGIGAARSGLQFFSGPVNHSPAFYAPRRVSSVVRGKTTTVTTKSDYAKQT